MKKTKTEKASNTEKALKPEKAQKPIKAQKKKGSTSVFTSIRARIVILLLACITAALVICYITIVPDSKELLIQSSENNLMDLSNANVRLIDKSIEAVNETMTSLARSQELYTYITLGGAPYKAQKAIDTYLTDNASFTAITIYDGEGKAILSNDESLVGSDGSSYEYIKKVMETGKIAQSDIILENVKTPSLICCIPLLSSSDDTVGVISVTVPADYITEILSESKLRNIESSYAFLISSDGNIIYHPQADSVGKVTENKVLQDVMKNLAGGKTVDTKAVIYENGNNTEYISYSVSDLNQWIVAIAADEDELLSSMNQLMTRFIMIILFELVILLLIGYAISSTITKPIKKLTKIIKSIADLNFTTDKESDKLSKRKDETGEMSRVIQKMRLNIREIIERINESSNHLNKNADDLDDICNNVNNRSNDNNATIEELLSAMEETSSTTETINQNISNIESSTKGINTKSINGIHLTNEIVERANTLQISSTAAANRLEKIYKEVKEETSYALEQSNAVTKITVLTNTIMEIAEQTKLLSLNASIEAARAGEAGKGFAVVAGEIGSLSAQSTQTVAEITSIVDEVTHAVRNIDRCLKNTLELIEKTVLPDYQGYISISNQYNKDAEVFNDTMSNIQVEIEKLSSITGEIAVSISEISITMNKSTEEVSDISERTTDIVDLTIETYNKAKENKVYAEELKDVVNKFEL